jgi:ABC-type uncharacterized transport system permease subunit
MITSSKLLIILTLWISEIYSVKTIRKDVRDMTQNEWDIYTSTIRKAITTYEPGSNVSIWMQNVNLHKAIYPQVHSNCMFFYFHRIFIYHMEKKLQDMINPSFFFPYW